MGAVRGHLGGALRLQRSGRGAQRASGIHDVVHQHAGLAFYVTDDVHHRGDIGARTALVDDGQVGIVEALGHGTCAHHATHVGRHHDQVFRAVSAPDVGKQQRRGVNVVHRDIEEALDLVGVQVNRQHAVGVDRAEHLGRHLGRDRHARRTQAAILARVTEVRHHRGNTGRRGALQRVDQHQQLHQVFRAWRAGRLDHEHFLPAHVLFDFHLHFAIGEARDHGLARAHAQFAADAGRQRFVGIAGKDKQVAFVLHVVRSGGENRKSAVAMGTGIVRLLA